MFSNEHNGHRDRGAAAVEMAIVLPLLLFVLFGLIDFGRAYNAQIQLSAAAREGVRLATLNPGATLAAKQADADYGDTAIKNRVHCSASGHNCPLDWGRVATACDESKVGSGERYAWCI